MATGSTYEDGWYWSADGLRLHYRDYAGDAARPVLLCLPGLTRSARDFEGLAERHAGEWRVICADLRGRGESAHAKDPLSYVPPTYVQDVQALLTAADVERFAVVGTSLGGVVAMMLAGPMGERLAGAVLNDIGPEIEMAGLERIRGNVGRSVSWPTWLHAARDLAARNTGIYPDWSLTDWLVFAKRLCRLTTSGRICFDYDPRIADAFKLPSQGFDLWPGLEALCRKPVLSLRGALSDVLTAATQARMVERCPGLVAVTVPRVGHAPTLDEAPVVAAIDAFLLRIVEETRP
ncbi:alpha/beta fold hydrolase [Glacieibacterium sp.]|uniref:alpha/beta fold hydrolase n=1 Tax=Glacieibacterium sp. TaxID=2860237 RepID=UPI003B0014A3